MSKDTTWKSVMGSVMEPVWHPIEYSISGAVEVSVNSLVWHPVWNLLRAVKGSAWASARNSAWGNYQ